MGTSETSEYAGLRRNGDHKVHQKIRASRKPLARFLAIARIATWDSFIEVKQSFSGVDYAQSTGVLIFNIGGNKYRLIATVDFDERIRVIKSVMTREEYNRENS
jgi:mRNA interferase HigB